MKETIREVDNIINELCTKIGCLAQYDVLSAEQGAAIVVKLAEMETKWLKENYSPEEYAFLMEDLM